jgi:hypothetical protein
MYISRSHYPPIDPLASLATSDTPGAAMATNRAGRRRQQAVARKQRKLFARYKVHMAHNGYDATFDDFINCTP